MQAQHLADALLQMGLAVRRRLIANVRAGDEELHRPIAHVGGDMVYGIDRSAESVIDQVIDSWPDEWKPILLIAEGINESGRKLFGSNKAPLRFRLLVDPIDGTRGLMYDKRSAWFASAIVTDRGEETTLEDTLAAVLVELPTSKQNLGDAFVAIRDRPTRGLRSRVDDDSAPHELNLIPSCARSLLDGFGHVVSFFPGTKVLAAELMEHIVKFTLGPVGQGQAQVFDDQYISTSGQLVELMVGHDRFCCDLRPLLFRIMHGMNNNRTEGLVCHSYDMAGWLVARQAGVILTDGFGHPLHLPLDVHHPVHWCGYANADLHAQIQPVITAWLEEHGLCGEPLL